MDQLFLEQVNATIENHLSDENFGVVELADKLGISRWQLHRRLKDISGQSPSQMIREVRLKKAFDLLQNNAANVSEVSYQVGFGSPTYFNTCFRNFFGYPPGKVKRIKSPDPVIKHSISRKYIFVSLIIAIVIVSLLVTNIIVSKNNTESAEVKIKDKSIAVLPFKCLSADTEKQYLADGVMEAILLNLSKIEDLRVIDRTSVEQYRETEKTSTIICQELDVKFLLEGSFQKYGDQARLILQLIEPGKEDHVWAHNYDRNWADVFSVQSEVALDVARELQAVITPEEKSLLQKIPTINTTAYDYYSRGREEHLKYQSDKKNIKALESAEKLYHRALAYDSAFAQAYTGLAWIYEDKYFWKTFLSENFLDTMLMLADRALSYDDQLAEAYVLRGDYYRFNGQKEQAINEYDEALRFNPNEWRAYWHKGDLYNYDDYVKTLENFQKTASLNRGLLLPQIYKAIGAAYAESGFKELCIYYYKEALKLDDDSSGYYGGLGALEESNCNFNKAIEYYKKSLAIDSMEWGSSFRLGIVYGFLGQFEESLAYMKLYERAFMTPLIIPEIPKIPHPHFIFRLGHAYHVNGFTEKADFIMNAGFEYYSRLLKLQRHYDQDLFIFRELSAMHAFMGNKDKAYENLRLLNTSQRFPLFMIKDVKNDPLLISLRGEPEFQQIIRDIEAKCQAEHERVRQWLEENDML
jgi:TolB-like protein/AraC-like DNA-binding protein/tetratricopeptide (TPR) repeat protein